MSKRITAAPSVQLTQQAIEKLITDSLSELSAKMQQEAASLSEKFTQEVTNMVRDLGTKVETELKELGTQTRTVSLQELEGRADDGVAYAFQLEDIPGVYKEGKKKKDKKSLYPSPKHPTPRDSEHNKNLLDFWRKNYDYGESPYMHLDEIEKITDKPPFKKKKRKKNE